MAQLWINKIIHVDADELDAVIASFNTPKVCPMCSQPHRGDSDVCEACEDDLLPEQPDEDDLS